MSVDAPITGGHLIDGAWIKSADPEYQATNPLTGETLTPPVSEAGPDEVDLALNAALDAQAAVRHADPADWAALLEQIAVELEADADAICRRAAMETALPAATRLAGEMKRSTGQLRLFAQVVRAGDWVDAVIDRADPARQPLPKPDIRRMLRPIGPVAVFGASNFPLAFGVAGGDTASALAAGNPVIAKGHPLHPGTNELVARAIQRALLARRLPAGLFALLQGAGQDVGAALVTHPGTAAVGFTGSLRGGRALYDLAAQRPRPIPVYAEMGSLNPLVLLPGALAEKQDAIVAGLAGSITLGCGQFCTKPGLILLLDGADTDGFLEALAAALASTGEFAMLSAGLRDGFVGATDTFADVAGVTAHLVGEADGHAGAQARLYSCSSRTWRNHSDLQEEAFGPGALVLRCRDLADLCHTLRQVQGSLTGTVHLGAADSAGDTCRVTDALAEIAGRVIVNGYPTGVEVCHAMVHGGPYPATSAAGSTSVGTLAIVRYARPVAFQGMPDALLPPELQNANPRGIMRRVDGVYGRDPIGG